MIRVSVHLIPGGVGRPVELARMDIANQVTRTLTNENFGDYKACTYRGRDSETLDRGQVMHECTVEEWPRARFHVWNLVAKCLREMGYTKGAHR